MQDNHGRLSLLLDHSCLILRNIFQERWRAKYGCDFGGKKQICEFLQSKNLKLDAQQSGTIKKKNLTLWDVSLLARVLVYGNWKQTAKIQSENDKIKRLKNLRNKDAHGPWKSASEFDATWEKVCDILQGFGEQKGVLNELKTRDLGKRVISPKLQEKIDGLLQRAGVRETEKKYDEAIVFYSEGISLDGIPGEQRGIFYSNRSECHLKKEAWEFALKDAQEACTLFPTAKAFYLKGRSYHSLGKYNKAVKAFDIGLAYAPKDLHLQEARQGSYYLLEKQTRHDHVDPHYNPSKEELYERMTARTGANWNAENSLKALQSHLDAGDPLGIGARIKADQYMYGIARPQNYKKAAHWYNECRLKKSGWAEGAHNLGVLTRRGEGVAQDFEAGVRLYEEAAACEPFIMSDGELVRNKGVAEAQNALGLAYLHGLGATQDIHKAILYLDKAVQNESSAAMNSLGTLFLRGQGVPRNPIKAVELYKEAFWTNNVGPGPAYNLATCYAEGLGVALDLEKAIQWFKMAEDLGLETAKAQRKRFEEMMQNPAQKLSYTDWVASRSMQRMKSQSQQPSLSTMHNGGSQYFEELESHAQGSPFVQDLLQANKSYKSVQHLIFNLPKTLDEEMEMINGIARAYHTQLSIFYPQHRAAALIEIAQKLFIRHDSQDAALVYGIMKAEISMEQEAKKIFENCHERWPQSPHFLWRLAELNQKCKRWSKSTANFTKLLGMCPNHVDAMYGRAVSRKCDGDLSGAFHDYLKFLEMSDIKHTKRAQAYYDLAACSSEPAKLKYFLLGLHAEENAIPIYLSVVTPHDIDIVDFVRMSQFSQVSRSRPKLEQGWRRELIQNHHKYVAYSEINLNPSGELLTVTRSLKLNEEQKGSDKLNQRRIYLEDMNPSKDQIYNGRVLRGMLVGIPVIMSAVHCFIVDDNGDMLYVAFHDNRFSLSDHKGAREHYYGKKVALINPFHRLRQDERRGIRVDDALSVIFLPSNHLAFCEYCYITDQEKAMLRCSRCQVVSYCSKECQTKDWKLGHKRSCPVIGKTK
eukprot:TRINITY_DN3456_c0_g1_i6.p1 TRINITY_DN3456_c0_g1~~TRINITY_DN3456_c0_g1_i6.p1  ORF type:complete len:1038 (+),score=135.30 TRINITY_DN3456_c0_g1_i6:30-3143(+)